MKKDIILPTTPVIGTADEALMDVQQSFERFCLAAGMETLGAMMEADVEAACGPRHGRVEKREAHRWGRTRGRIGFHGGEIAVERPRVRRVDGREAPIPSWDQASSENWLGRWAMNLMLINVSTRRFGRAVRLPEGDVPVDPGSGVSKSATSRRFVALSSEKLDVFMGADLSKLDLVVIQIDGLHVRDDLVLVAAIGIDGDGGKHPLTALVNRQRRAEERPAINAKRDLRIMRRHGLTLERSAARRPGRTQDGVVIALRSNVRWCSDHLEIHARNREVVRVLFVLDTCDREIIAWLAAANAGISGEMVRDLMVAAVERRFGTTKSRIRWNGSPITAAAISLRTRRIPRRRLASSNSSRRSEARNRTACQRRS